MRKITRIIGLMCMSAVLAVGSMSCKKNDTKNASFTFALPTVEGFASGDEKGYIDPIDGWQMKWYEGDQMMIYNLDASNPANSIAEVYTAVPGSQGQTLTPFSGTSLGAKKTGFFAFYPADKADLSKLHQNNRGRWSVGANQTFDPTLEFGAGWENRFYMDPRGVVMAEIADDFMTGSTMIMRHVFGFVNLRVRTVNNSYTKEVASITIHDKKVHLTGPIELNILDITEERLSALQTLGNQYAAGEIIFESYWAQLQAKLSEMGYTSEPQGFDVTIEGPANYGAVSINDAKKYFIVPLRPGALVGGFDVIINYADGTSETKSFSGQEYVIRPGWFVNLDIVL